MYIIFTSGCCFHELIFIRVCISGYLLPTLSWINSISIHMLLINHLPIRQNFRWPITLFISFHEYFIHQHVLICWFGVTSMHVAFKFHSTLSMLLISYLWCHNWMDGARRWWVHVCTQSSPWHVENNPMFLDYLLCCCACFHKPGMHELHAGLSYWRLWCYSMFDDIWDLVLYHYYRAWILGDIELCW